MKLKFLRNKHHMKQWEVADYLHCTASTYCRYENGKRQPPADMLQKLAKLYEVSVDYLLGPSDNTVDYSTIAMAHAQEDVLALSDYEAQLIYAARNADSRAREDALRILNSHNNDSLQTPQKHQQ